MDFIDLSQQCAPSVAHETMAALVSVESSFNPYAIGVVGGKLVRQPRNSEEAIKTAIELEKQGWNFSLGLAQVNLHNLSKYDIDYAGAFTPCTNLRVGAEILSECFSRASKITGNEQSALQAAFSCYYSGNFSRGFRPDHEGQISYVDKVLAQAAIPLGKPQIIPALKAGASVKALRATKQKKAKPLFPSDSPILLKNENAKVPIKDREPEAKPNNSIVVF